MSKNKTVVLKKSDVVSIIFGEWRDRTYGNTYYDTVVIVNDDIFGIAYQYGYSAGKSFTIDSALAECGYRVRANKVNKHAPYDHISVSVVSKFKRELIKANC